MYNINLLITTYNRPAMLCDLLAQITAQSPVKCVIHIHNDGSTANYLPVINKFKGVLDLRYFYHNHYGKKRYWALINKVFKNRADAKYYIMLPDDDILKPDFFNKLINKWESIEDTDKITLMPSINPERKWFSCFTPVIPKQVGGVYNSGYVDMRFIAEDEFFQEVGTLEAPDSDRWDKDPDLGSGVGSQISNRLYEAFNLYISEEDLTYQVAHRSQMNPNQIDTAI